MIMTSSSLYCKTRTASSAKYIEANRDSRHDLNPYELFANRISSVVKQINKESIIYVPLDEIARRYRHSRLRAR